MLETEQMLEIQGRLRADHDGAERRRLGSMLEALRLQSRQALAAGGTPSEFRALEALAEAADAAAEVLEAASIRYPAADPA